MNNGKSLSWSSKKKRRLAMTKTIKSSKITPAPLSLLNPKCAGIDIGASEIFVCIAKNSSKQEVRSFSTFTADLKRMIIWLKDSGVKSVSMESTGVYWLVPYEMLEEAGFEVLLVNARFFKSVPGRKTDVQDCQWIQQLHSYGLLRGSFRPSHEIVELRTYVRQRSRLFELAGVQVQLMHKALIQMNIQLNHVISDITGVTGLKIIQAILQGTRNPKTLANLSVGSCRKNREIIAKALEGNFRKEHLFALEQAYEAYEFFHRQIHKCEKAIEMILSSIQVETPPSSFSSDNDKISETSPSKKRARKTQGNRSPYYFNAPAEIKKVTVADLTTIPGIDASTAMKILSEIGTDTSQWANAKAFSSWLGLCPGNKISGGKILNSKTKASDNRAAQALRMAASSLYRSKTAIGAFFRRMRARLGAPKAITAAAHKLARILYRMLTEGANYREAGENYYEQQYQARVVASLSRRAEELGYVLTSTK
jgi:transposase